MGAECIMDHWQELIWWIVLSIEHNANNETSKQRKQALKKRLQVVESFRESNLNRENRPEWMIMKVVPVIPPELRPFATWWRSFCNFRFKWFIPSCNYRNNRLKRLMEIKSSRSDLKKRKRMLQESVDSFDNTRKASAVKQNQTDH
jgi:DNA-directed RNA polymerase subunit beta'